MIGFRRFAAFALTALAGACVGSAITAAHAGPSHESPYDVVRQLARALVHVESVYVDAVDRTKLLRGAVKGMVSELDPHSAYLTPEEWTEFKNDNEGRFAGIGIEVDLRGGGITVIAPIEGSPAERAGLKPGDRIVAIDGEPVIEPSLETAVKRMRGPVGTHVKLAVRRQGAQNVLTFEIVRAIVHLQSVRGKLLVGNIGYIRINQFREGTESEFLRTIATLKQGARGELAGVVLDLRNNPGGLVDQAANVADELLDRGGIYVTRHRGEVVENIVASRGGALAATPLVALVNEGSASASELLVGALQDDNRALVVGSQTFGKGSVQVIIELPDGAGMKLTTARYYSPSGHAIQADGIQPDVVIASKMNEGIGTFTERSFENHLPGEARTRPRGPQLNDAGVITAPEDGGLDPTDVRTMPADPRGAADYGLEVAYDVLVKQVIPRGTWVR